MNLFIGLQPRKSLKTKCFNMQPKESKTNTHFWISLVKSGFRFGAGIQLILGNIISAGILFVVAEILGVAEEIF